MLQNGEHAATALIRPALRISVAARIGLGRCQPIFSSAWMTILRTWEGFLVFPTDARALGILEKYCAVGPERLEPRYFRGIYMYGLTALTSSIRA